MKKVYLLLLLCCISFVALSQTTTVTIYATGAAGTFITGNSTNTVRQDGNIVTTAGTRRGYAVFDLSSLPAGVSITACTLGFNTATYTGTGVPANWNTRGFSGDLSTVTTAAALFADMASGTSLSTATYGTAAGNQTVAITTAGDAYLTGRIGATVSICWTGGANRVYTITGETGSATTTGTHAPYLSITYCNPPTAVTATAAPNPLCVGSTLNLTGAATGATTYSWAGPGGYTAATQNATSVTTTASAGVYTLTATSTCGALASSATAITSTVTINPSPAPILGGTNVCTGRTLNLTDASTGGAWSVSGTSAATISATGVVTGVASGTTIVTYTLGTGCLDTLTVTDFDGPAPITGGASIICVGTNLNLADATTGGVWSSSNPAAVTVSTTGVATALAGGSTVISYTLPSGCFASANIIVNPATAPPAITGNTTECQGSNTTLHDGTGAGTWSSSNTGIALIYPTGVVYGITPGTATITFTAAASGCSTTTTVTVVATPPAITGSRSLCSGTTTTLTDATTGGTWTSSNTAVATVDPATGVVSGVSLGTTIISYIVPPGCPVLATFTVNPLPAAIAGPTVVCTGGSITLTDATTGGGTWSSSNTAAATVGLSSGVVFGVAPGATVITFTAITGCTANTTIVDADPPVAITGGDVAICAGGTVTLADATTGGTWSSASTAIANVDGTGLVTTTTGTAGGVVNISYTVVNACSVTTPITVNPSPAAIGGSANVCTGLTSTLTDAATGGTWSSSNTAVATINSTTGAVTGILAGTSTITYTLGTGCIVTLDITDTDPPAAITGGSVAICQGSTVTLTETSTGGAWTSSSTAIATVDATGLVTGAGGGVATISYSFGTGCSAQAVVTVNPLPAAITSAAVCTGSNTTFTDATTGGTWSSSNTVVATINTTTGVATGLSAGTSTISYTLGTGCFVTTTITDNDPPPALGFTTTEICQGTTTTLTEANTDGTWSSSATTVATVDATGLVTGTGGGVTTISYTEPSGCFVTQNITVDPTPASIGGPTTVCTGSAIQLTDATTGGTWSSQLTAVATVNATGLVTGAGAGTTNISYTITATGCFTTLAVTDNDPPGTIGGLAVVCAGSITALTETTTGGTWSSTNTAVATIDGVGDVTGVSQGTTTISYVLGTGCFTTIDVTVNPLPAAIGGSNTVCTGSTTQLTDANIDGTWSSQFPAIADVDGTGLVTGFSTGVTDISYTITATGCFVTVSMTDNPVPVAITGPSVVCQLATIALADGTGGGGWLSSNTTNATIDPTGVVTGVTAGTTTISYILGTGCFVTIDITVNPIPAAITGDTAVCTGSTTQLNETNTDGSWSNSVTGIADVDATGLVTGISAGTTTISYIITATGCYVTASMRDNDPPTAIIGTTPLCVGATATFTDGVAENGMWSSMFPLIATADAFTGDVFGSSPGTDTILYTIVACPAAKFALTVNPAPLPITGPNTVCVGSTITLSDATTGGGWSTGSPGLVLVSSTGDVTGQNAGVATIYYTTSGCTPVSYTVTVNPTPTAISGVDHICATFTTTLTDGVSGGVWTSSNTAAASIDPSLGVVFGAGAGTAVITYTLPAGCFKTFLFTVNPLPAPITFPTAVVCQGSTILFSDATTGGTWSSGNSGIAAVGTGSGLITGVTAGTANIIYTLPTGCLALAPVTVNPLPLPSTGVTTSVCVRSTITLVNSSPGGPGSWSSSNTSLATVGLGSGVVTGVSAGTVSIVYSLPTGCNTSTTVTVNPLPAAIFGVSDVCVGSSITLTDVTPGGTFSTTSGAATVGLLDGVVNGMSAGVANISYTLTLTGCTVTTPVSVNPLPAPIGGLVTVCTGSSITLTDADSGGTWTSTNTAVATITSVTGVITGVTTGSTNVNYTFPTGCTTGTVISVVPTPTAIITAGGPTAFCTGGSVVLTATAGAFTYQWYQDGTAITGAAGNTYAASTSGDYTVVVTSPFGCSDSSAATAVSDGIFPTIDYAGSSTLCAGNHLTMTVNTGAAVGVITYEWYNGASPIPGASDITYTANTAGIYYSQVTISGASGFCTVNSDSVTIIINPLPVPIVTFDGTTLATLGSYTAYEWFLNTVGIPGATDSTFVPVVNGSYRVLVVDANGCDGYSAAAPVAYVGIKEINKTDIRIYPNPASATVHIAATEKVRAVITGLEGKTLLEQDNAKDVDISGLANGVYLMMIYNANGDQLKVEKLIKE